ncbi:hypothetical protein H0H81_008210 [Sphagnurus paluster]|uniref:HORMA domain-containing protein n=1 Tax=Sphagnurus paluster TaxID=117069 RepID=A0A9P7FXM4_9AGAR|nr:hypothetical protein H0H81_008210 [Sphagnurus paluster]
MTLGDGLQKMSLKDKRRADNPVTEALKKGKAPTLLDVKKSVKALLKTLIQATTQMDVLPKRRYATFKLFYTDKTPPDYEPPHFQAGDEEKDKWFFMTHDLDEVPDKWSIGKVDTGHHSVNLSVTSIATYLPSSTQQNNATFGGTASRLPNAPRLTPVQEATIRAAQAEQQLKDAQQRNIAWCGEEAVEDVHDIDGEGEDDPDYIRLPDGSYQRVASDNCAVTLAPIGIRNNETGVIEPLNGPMDVEEAHFGGAPEVVPTRLHDLNVDRAIEKSNIEQTQVIEDFTQDLDAPVPSRLAMDQSRSSSLAAEKLFDSEHRGSSWPSPAISPITSHLSSQGSDADMEMLKDMQIPVSMIETQTLDMETQIEPIESFKQASAQEQNNMETRDLTPNAIHAKRKKKSAAFARVAAAGGITYGAWAENDTPDSMTSFARAYGNGNNRNDHVRQLFKRLETEGFIVGQSTALDDLGFPTVHDKTKKSKAQQPKNRKNVQRTKFMFNRAVLQTTQYQDYFDPDPQVEARIIGISELTAHLKSHHHASGVDHSRKHAEISVGERRQVVDETQTQAETQSVIPLVYEHALGMKRKNTMECPPDVTPKRKKKVKISIAHGLDLAE